MSDLATVSPPATTLLSSYVLWMWFLLGYSLAKVMDHYREAEDIAFAYLLVAIVLFSILFCLMGPHAS